MGQEIERKFLVDAQRWAAAAKPAGVRLRQGYLAQGRGATVRVRLSESAAYLTIKGPTQGLVRDEFEYAIPLADAEQLLDRLAVAELSKTRYTLEVGAAEWVVDVFEGRHEGLLLAEVELQSPEQTFEYPDWLGPEVSHDWRYTNSALAQMEQPPT